MFGSLIKLFDNNEKQVQKAQSVLAAINALEPEFEKLKDADLAKKTLEFKDRYQNGESLDALLPEAFANVREAAKRTIKQRHYDVQIIGGIVLHQGKIAEMKTGEGKTLVATLPLYLNALTGNGSHLVTVNGFLARLGAGWNGPIYGMLGLSTSTIDHDFSAVYDPEYTDEEYSDERLRHWRKVTRKEAYQADITYGTNNEFGFDYLRDNMVQELDQMVQRPLSYAIVDEVDSILIDEARTPLIISAPAQESNEQYMAFAKLVKQLSANDYVVDEKSRSASLTETGADKIDKWLGVSNVYDDFALTHHLDMALKATYVYHRDKDYVIRDGEVVIVDEFTGRLMPGRRYSEGLHQAIEAKEGVEIQKESKTLATITFQNYFRLYEKLGGMTGTAETEAEEFAKLYKLDVVVIPTNKPNVRKDFADYVYKTQRAKYNALIAEVIERHKAGQPVLVGTTSVSKNELLSEMLTKQRIPHEVLNAKNHEREAEIIAKAGQKGAITIATNMAGRGTDILLAEGVADLGGLHVIGTERHESRRIDNQLRGRAGRQGDPGSSRFYVALDDDLMRLFGGERIAGLMTRLNVPEDMPIENALVSRSIESSQVKVEGFNFDTRKHVVEYDDVINKQREIIYARRRRILESMAILKRKQSGAAEESTASDPEEQLFDAREHMERLLEEAAHSIVLSNAADRGIDVEGVMAEITSILPQDDASLKQLRSEIESLEDDHAIHQRIGDLFSAALEARQVQMGADSFSMLTHLVILTTIDRLWMDHIDVIDDLRTGVGLRAYGQRDPLIEFKNEAYKLFERLIGGIDYEVTHQIFKVELIKPQPMPKMEVTKQELETGSVGATLQADALTPESETGLDAAIISKYTSNVPVSRNGKAAKPTTSIDKSKLGRNDECWCGSGKKYKRCHYPN
jgi:preprotein translocase subunit SecA